MAIAGLRGTGDWGTDERPKNFRELILWSNPNGAAPIFALTAKTKKANVDDPQFTWWEEIQGIIRVVEGGVGLNSSATALTLVNSSASNAVVDSNGARGNGLDLVIGDLLMVESASGVTVTFDNEIVTVTAIASATAITISRGSAGSTAAAIASGAKLTKIGNAFSEGSRSPEATSRNPRKFTNYCQIFKTAYEVTETSKVTGARTGNVLKNDKKRRSFDHSVSLEMALLLGKPYETTGSNSKPLRYTGGLLSFLTTAGRAKVYSSSPDASTFFDDIYDVFDYNSEGGAGDERICYCGNIALNKINKMAAAAGDINFSETVKLYGMNLTKWVTPQGSFYFKSHPLMNQHPNLSKSIFITDPTGIRYRPLRDTKPMDNIQETDEDTDKGQWLTEAGFEFNYMEGMKYLGNVA
jgi:hypothetical protein